MILFEPELFSNMFGQGVIDLHVSRNGLLFAVNGIEINIVISARAKQDTTLFIKFANKLFAFHSASAFIS